MASAPLVPGALPFPARVFAIRSLVTRRRPLPLPASFLALIKLSHRRPLLSGTGLLTLAWLTGWTGWVELAGISSGTLIVMAFDRHHRRNTIGQTHFRPAPVVLGS